MKISPSIASANPLRLEEEIKRLDHFDDIHIDIEDGNFIPNITFGMKTIHALRSVTNKPFSFHLMVTNPYQYLDEIFRLRPSILFAHAESLPYVREFIGRVKGSNIKCGLAFNPATPVEPYLYLLKELDAVLIMTAEPDGRDQAFIEEMLGKVKTIHEKQPPLNIWVDGNISHETLPDLEKIGVTTAVMGRAIFN
ncbi:ribulose-phosphate 3-epimerase [Neobacillus muris]|uniref:ribulose-phosphate 3-epimerase n=1 Tax=Neobacillus muris TaxID=2941334 RepID=UPI00203EACD3|nr:ribulose-phosphate 3-epimerase [Neobacillus muris]